MAATLQVESVQRKLHWERAIGLGVVVIGTAAALVTVLVFICVGWWEWKHVLVGVVSGMLMGCSVSVYFHRYLTHYSFEFTPLGVVFAQPLLAISANAAQQSNACFWEGAHDKHHAGSDTDDDPHSPNDGWLHAHGLWILGVEEPSRTRFNQLPQVNWVAWFFSGRWVSLIFGPALALVVAYAVAGWQGPIWYLVAVGVVWHLTASVNSLCHLDPQGYRNPGPNTWDRSINRWWIALLTWGEGWHHNHHQHQKSARFGRRWWEIDKGYYVIRLMQLFWLVRKVRAS